MERTFDGQTDGQSDPSPLHTETSDPHIDTHHRKDNSADGQESQPAVIFSSLSPRLEKRIKGRNQSPGDGEKEGESRVLPVSTFCSRVSRREIRVREDKDERHPLILFFFPLTLFFCPSLRNTACESTSLFLVNAVQDKPSLPDFLSHHL